MARSKWYKRFMILFIVINMTDCKVYITDKSPECTRDLIDIEDIERDKEWNKIIEIDPQPEEKNK